MHEGIATCGGSTCHGRLAPTGKIVRQNEIFTWQDDESAAGSHYRAYQVLGEPRARAIAKRLGIGDPQTAPACIGCHTETVPAGLMGDRFQKTDGIGCEACHGGSGGWLARHYAVGTAHMDNVARGLIPLEDPKTRVGVCLGCHLGSTKPGQFVSHRFLSAGHPRLSFELDLFSALQKHYDIDADYARRKTVAGGTKIWAVGQAEALLRFLSLYADPALGQDGMFPQFVFFDCQGCHRRVFDDPAARLSVVANPGRPIEGGSPPFDDENMIMLSAAARAVAPALASRFDTQARAFNAAAARGRGAALSASGGLIQSTRALEAAFEKQTFDRDDTFKILNTVLSNALATRYTDYSGSAQAVMAADTLLSALDADKAIDHEKFQRIRPDIEMLYKAVRDPNLYTPAQFRGALQHVASATRELQ
ncbi:MAG TPA: multiheme c-type cytochrome [Rhizomicrobium sp.]|jgi:hypothetical protein